MVAAARHFMNTMMNGHGVGRVALGPSTSRLVDSLAYCYSTVLGPQDEVLVQVSEGQGSEARELQRRGAAC